MAQTTDKNKSNNESDDNIPDISNRDSAQSVDAATSLAPDSGEGISSGDTTISNEINKDSFHEESNLAKADKDTDNHNNTECNKDSDSDDIQLQWDDDDENNTTGDGDTHVIDDDFENKVDAETEQNNQDSSKLLEKETELILEDKLIQEHESTDVLMEFNEDELLQNEQPEDSEATNVDASDKDSKKQEESLKENTLDVSNENQEKNAITEIKGTSKSNDDSLSMDVDDDVSQEDSILDAKTSCGLRQPDVMIEIPTQETIDINDLPDSPIDASIDDCMEKIHNKSEEEVAAPSVENPQPSTSTVIPQMIPDTSNEAQEVTDCLGLLAESSRVMDEDEDQDDDGDDGDADDDEDFDQDESSNQMTAEHSEDSNAQNSENEPPRGGLEPEEGNFAFDEVDIDENSVDGDLRMEFKQESESNDDEGRVPLISGLKHARKSTEINEEQRENDILTKEKDGTSNHQDNIKKENEDHIVSTTVRKENDSTSVSQDNLEKADNVISTWVTGDEESTSESQVNVMKLKEDNIIPTFATKEEDGTSILQNNVTEENENNITSICVTKQKESITVSQDNMNKRNEKAISSVGATEKSQEDTVLTDDDAVQLESAVLSLDPVNSEREDAIPFGVKIKIEKEHSTKPRPIVATQIVRKYVETQINDDVIEQVLEIETVKISDDEDDEDDEPPMEIQENLQQKTDMTTPLEKPLQGTTVLEKNMLAEVTALEDNTEIEKSTDTTAASEATAVPETTAAPDTATSPDITSELEKLLKKTTKPDNATINLTLDETNIEEQHTADGSMTSPNSSRMKNLTMATQHNTSIISFVELGESSSEDDIQEVNRDSPPEHSISHLQKLLDSSFKPPSITSMTTVSLPTAINFTSTSDARGTKTQIAGKEREVVTSRVLKALPHKTAKLNTSEVSIKTASSSEQTLVIPEAKAQEQTTAPAPAKPRLNLEIFSLDSDEEETPAKAPEKPKKKTKKCINGACSSGSTELQAADKTTAEYYDGTRKKRPVVCQPCADAVLVRKQKLMEGIKNMTPLLKIDSCSSQDLVEILDSDSEGEDSEPQEQQRMDTIGEEAAKFLEKNLADVLNETWKKYKLDDRLKETEDEINAEILKLEQESKELNKMLDDCQRVTDKLRSDFYATFEHRKVEIPSLLIYETPEFTYMGPDTEDAIPATVINQSRLLAKRKMVTNNEIPAKRPAIPLGYTPLENPKRKVQENKADDDKDISVVKLSAESAPADLPPPGELSRPPLRVGMAVYAMKNAFGPWFKGKVIEITAKSNTAVPFTMCRIKFDHKLKNNSKVLPARCIAYAEPAEVRMTIGTRLIALFKDANKRESFYSGVVAEIPNPVNNYRYLVFFDDGYAQYVSHGHTRLVCECSNLVWEEVHPLSREFVREYLMAYPERPMVRLHEGQHLKTEWDGKWWSSRVARVDASLAQVVFLGDGRREWVYRGSTRLAPLYLELRAAERHRPRPMPRSTQPRSNLLPYVEYTRSVEQPTDKAQETQPVPVALTTQQQTEQEIRRQRAVAKKSTTTAALPTATMGPTPVRPPLSGSGPGGTTAPLDSDNSRVVYYTPKNAVRPYKLVPHTCSPACKRSDVLSLKELRTYNPLAKPLLSGWERQIVRYKGQREVMYRAPCGRRVRSLRELHRYLRATDSDLPVDLFDFHPATHCLAEFVLHKCLVGKKDLSHGKENVPVPCVNCYDESLPEFCSYNTERTPTSGVPLNLDPEFLCGCDCTDDCEDKSKCACWKMTLEGARTIGLDVTNVGYVYKRLPEPLPSGIYECNSRCKCKQTCLNRVAQHPLQLKLQVFKTLNRGWGIRALNDVPKGAFLCVYAGNLLTDATANLDGLNEGDEYLAELDYIEVVEQMKEGYEEDIPDADKKLDKKDSIKPDESEEEPSSSSEDDENGSKTDEDDDFKPGYVALGVSDFSKSLRKRSTNKKDAKTKEGEEKEKENKGGDPEEDCITISDDDEVREPSRFTANPGMAGNDFVSKYRSVRTLFGEDEACYIMDAKVQGNIGRYLNHSCSPNVFVQNVFVDTHDPRFPWVAFFALSHVKAGTELTWNYNYDVGSVPGKILYCYCEAPNCRGRLL